MSGAGEARRRSTRTRADVETVREALPLNDVDPAEVHDGIDPDDAASSSR